MKDQNVNQQRRRFLTTAGAAATLIPVTALIGSRAAYSADMVDVGSAQAVSLEYVAKSADETKTCSNCALYASVSDTAGTCPLFSGAQVGSGAYCKTWTAKG